MDCKERGLLPGSQYFFFSPSDSFLEHNYGVTNCGYFICRFNYAKIILKSTDNSISQITDMLGYSSTGSFINAFKRRVGISPARFRKELFTDLDE